MRTVRVNTRKAYDILIGRDILLQTGETVKKKCGGSTAVLVTDNTVNNLYGNIVYNSLEKAGYTVKRFVFRSGEDSKNIETLTAILNMLAEEKLTRSDTVVALGGGVTGDMAGFAAAIYLRGIKLVQIPTTLLAMVDSSVGGKTAVNLPAGKNLAGAFYQPDIVICDTGTLKTLPREIYTDGCAEMIKHAIALDSKLFDIIKQTKQQVPENIEDIVERNIIIKRDIVVRDEKDTGLRQILNFGHTIGHAIEKCSRYMISHGRAVAAGMAVVALGAFKTRQCNEECYTKIIGILKQYELPTKTDYTSRQLIEAIYSDKKRKDTGISLIVPVKIGKCIIKEFAMDEAEDFLRMGCEPV